MWSYVWNFQYPQSDRALCNRSSALSTLPPWITFSIPNRIEPSATRSSLRIARTLIPFSIPNRIEPSATAPDAKRGVTDLWSFSIPNRIEPSATLVPNWARRRDVNFQYPQSDRALCNWMAQPIPVGGW